MPPPVRRPQPAKLRRLSRLAREPGVLARGLSSPPTSTIETSRPASATLLTLDGGGGSAAPPSATTPAGAGACVAHLVGAREATVPLGPTGAVAPALHLRVRANADAWASAGAGSEVLRWIREGYQLPWLGGRRPLPFNQGVSCRGATPQQKAFLAREIERLQAVGALAPATDSRWVTRAFLVPKPGKSDSWRLVVDLRWINSHLQRTTCRMETLRLLSRLARRDDWMISLDLQDGYYAVGIHPQDQQYLTVNLEGFGLLRFSALPMGLSASPYVFCKTMRTFVRALRSPLEPLASELGRRWAPRAPPWPDLERRFGALMRRGLRVLSYVDDFLLLCSSEAEAREARAYVEAVLDALGLARSPSKGCWEPVQQLKHLGLGVDTRLGRFYVTQDRLQALHGAGRSLLCAAAGRRGMVPVRQLAGFAGLAQSLYLAVPGARLHLRALHDLVSQATATSARWHAAVRLPSQVRSDLNWFVSLSAHYSHRPIWRSAATVSLYCDASKLAWGASLEGRLPARGFWRAHQRREHITLLEARAVRYAVASFLGDLRGHQVRLHEDNQAVVHMLTSWTSRSPALMRQLRKLWMVLDANNITLHPSYIRSEDNVEADNLSRQADAGDYRLDPAIFDRLDRRWGPHSIDRFATSNNKQVARFNSAWAMPGSEGVDAFAQTNWRGETNYCNPPWGLLGQLAAFLYETGAPATVVAPHWPAQPWYPVLRAMAAEHVVLPARRGMFAPGALGSFTPIGPPSWPLALFRVPLRPPQPAA